MENDLKVTPKGTKEVVYLGETYNKIYDVKSTNEKKLIHSSNTDALTGIYNRRAFEQICAEKSTKDTKLAIILIDLDNFKTINDTFGHSIGDKALKLLAKTLENTFRKNDFVCRIGGDEFAVILSDFTMENKSAITTKMNIVRDKLSNRSNDVPRFTISAGAAISTTGYSEELYKQADGALYIIKNTGKNGCFVYAEDK